MAAAAAAAALVAGAASMAAAPGASAVEWSSECAEFGGGLASASNELEPSSTSAGFGAYFAAGDVLLLSVGSLTGSTSATIVYDEEAVGTTLTTLGSTTFVIPSTGFTLVGIGVTFGGPGSVETTLTCSTPAAGPVAGADDDPIPAWVQAYARVGADETCIEGWYPSWDQWPNGGTGGFVCQRSVPSRG